MISQTDRIRSELLALRFRRGDHAAFDELVALWEKPMFYYLRRLTRTEEDAWDALQETWLRVFRSGSQLRKVESLVPWLYRVARNAAFNQSRDNPEWNAFSESDAGALEQERDGSPEFSAADAEIIHRALDQLALAQREVLTLFFLEEFSLKEISTITGAAIGTVKSRLHYGKRALRGIMQKDGYVHE